MNLGDDQISTSLPISLGGKYLLCINTFYKCDWCSIFNTPEFFKLHATENSFYFQLCLGTPPTVVGVVHFTPVTPGHYRSPRRGTFGGFEFLEHLRMEVVEGFVAEVERILKANGARVVEVLEPPAIIAPARAAVLYNLFWRKGYQVQTPELDYTLTVDDTPFLEKVEYNLRKRINKCCREGMKAIEVDPSLHRPVYDVIAANRAARGFPITMTYEAILKMVEVFPDRLVFFGVFAGDNMIASSICVRVNPSYLYVFYWGDLPGYEKFSSVSLLAQTIYDYAKQNGFSLLGIGISTIDGIPNYGLINFKRELGCAESLKLSFVKHLS